MKKILLIIFLGSLIMATYYFYSVNNKNLKVVEKDTPNLQNSENLPVFTHPLQIVQMRKEDYPGSELIIKRKLGNQGSFTRYVATYESEGLEINGLLTIPNGDVPEGGWPAIIFNHGYIRPETYRREEKYVAYIAGFARNGYVVFMPDYRGHQDSEGKPLGAYFSPSYTTDSLNAFYSLAKRPDVNSQKMGMWGHSMGGNITLRSMVISPNVKVGVIWAGVVASYEDMLTNWRRSRPWRPSERENMAHRPSRDDLVEEYGEAEENNEFWRSISPIYFVTDISGPVQLHHGTSDTSVPWEFSKSLETALKMSGKTVEYFEYKGADHNLSGVAFTPAINRSVEFFNTYLK